MFLTMLVFALSDIRGRDPLAILGNFEFHQYTAPSKEETTNSPNAMPMYKEERTT